MLKAFLLPTRCGTRFGKALTKNAVALVSLSASAAHAQVPPANKYDTSSYPKDRKAIEQLGRKNDSTRFHNDDYMAVGPEGRISYGFDDWKKGFVEEGATFKSVKPVPGTTILRIYNGDAAVKDIILDVVFATTKGTFQYALPERKRTSSKTAPGILWPGKGHVFCPRQNTMNT